MSKLWNEYDNRMSKNDLRGRASGRIRGAGLEEIGRFVQPAYLFFLPNKMEKLLKEIENFLLNLLID
jgi:hypothetical protein